MAPLPAGRIRYAGLAILAALAAALWWAPPWLVRFQASGFDAFQTLAPRQIDTLPVQIVEVDERSITARGQLPRPRTMLAELIRDIARGDPAAIGIDILMPEADRLSPGRALEQVGATDPVLAARIGALPGNDGELARAMGAVPVVLALLPARRDPTRGQLVRADVAGDGAGRRRGGRRGCGRTRVRALRRGARQRRRDRSRRRGARPHFGAVDRRRRASRAAGVRRQRHARPRLRDGDAAGGPGGAGARRRRRRRRRADGERGPARAAHGARRRDARLFLAARRNRRYVPAVERARRVASTCNGFLQQHRC